MPAPVNTADRYRVVGTRPADHRAENAGRRQRGEVSVAPVKPVTAVLKTTSNTTGCVVVGLHLTAGLILIVTVGRKRVTALSVLDDAELGSPCSVHRDTRPESSRQRRPGRWPQT